MSLLMAMVFSAVSWAQDANFSGSWVLNEQRSQSMDPIFTLQDIPWAQRKLASGLDAQATITQAEDRLTVTFINFIGTHNQVLVFNGQPHATVNPAGLPTTLATSWQGDVLVARGSLSSDGQAATLTERRSLSPDGQTMTVQIKLVTADGQQASTRRVYDRQ